MNNEFDKLLLLNKKIPTIDLPKIQENFNFINSDLVEVSTSSGLIIDLQYLKLGMDNATQKCFVRREVLKKLLKAKEYLPKELTFKILDAYRPLSLQKELYYKYKEKIITEFNLKKMTIEEQDHFINRYVSIPEENEKLAPLHTTGGAIDLILTNLNTGEDLEFGIPFDSFSYLTRTDAFERDNMNEEIRNNRRILYNSMIEAGFTNYPSEYWHFDYGNKNWAYYKNKPIMYKGIFNL